MIASIRLEDSKICALFSQLINDHLPVKFKDIVLQTEKDTALKLVSHFIINGWPAQGNLIECESARKFFPLRESLSMVSGCVTYRDRIVIPVAFRAKVLQSLHASHQGIARTKALARGYVYWPSIDADIAALIHRCQPCAQAAKQPPKCSLSAWPTPSGPWERVHMDYAGPVFGKYFFIVVDAFTKWPEVFPMSSTTTAATIEKLDELISRFGSMTTLVSDNGPQFTSTEFKNFCAVKNIEHLTTAPYHPASNGLAERFVDTLKRALSKHGVFNHARIHEFLRDYRATPHDAAPDGLSPAQLMFGRKMKIPLDSVRPPTQHVLERNSAMEEAYNRKHGARNRTFAVGERILTRFANGSQWQEGVVLEKIGAVMYNVLLDSGKLRRVHANQLRHSDLSSEKELSPLGLSEAIFLDDPEINEPPAASSKRPNPRACTRTSPINLRPRNK